MVVLHQNAYPKGKVVQRETWPLAGISGYVAGYRPWNWPDGTPYAPACPVRWSAALAMSEAKGKAPQSVDLLKLVDPRLDRVQGIWFFEKDGRLRSPCEFEARLQVPVALPKSYTVRMAVERLQGSQLSINHQDVINWQGDSKRLSVSPDWLVPHDDWLFISAYNSEFEISSFALEVVN